MFLSVNRTGFPHSVESQSGNKSSFLSSNDVLSREDQNEWRGIGPRAKRANPIEGLTFDAFSGKRWKKGWKSLHLSPPEPLSPQKIFIRFWIETKKRNAVRVAIMNCNHKSSPFWCVLLHWLAYDSKCHTHTLASTYTHTRIVWRTTKTNPHVNPHADMWICEIYVLIIVISWLDCLQYAIIIHAQCNATHVLIQRHSAIEHSYTHTHIWA